MNELQKLGCKCPEITLEARSGPESMREWWWSVERVRFRSQARPDASLARWLGLMLGLGTQALRSLN